jgi:hypothetical protein
MGTRLGLDARPALVNGTPGWVSLLDGHVYAVAALTVRNGKITKLDLLLDPERFAGLDLSAFDPYASSAMKFTATIRYWYPEGASGLVVADISAEHVARLGGLKQVRVRGTINGAEYTSNVMPEAGRGARKKDVPVPLGGLAAAQRPRTSRSARSNVAAGCGSLSEMRKATKPSGRTNTAPSAAMR